ncbi:phosphatase PAP2 family protein [Pasteurellaceae bacterium LIM206]|nr:phosphatase PAP2 family protein [Pasteurellaceae bacterium LIM206]
MLKRLSLYTFLLCLVPFFVWISGWYWQGDGSLTAFDHFLYWLTETGSIPYAIITCGLFALLLAPIFPKRYQWVIGVIIMALSVVVTQGIKNGLKAVFAEPRPYVVELTENSRISTEYFYAQSKADRAMMVANYYARHGKVPSWLVQHREDEVSYSFPSGHSIFAAGWLLLAVGFSQLFGSNSLKTKAIIAVLTVWAVLMLVSRLRLGMHNPIDLFVSTLIAWLIYCPLFVFLQKKTIFFKEFHPRCR